MSVRPALVDCVVLFVQDSCVFYPCCKGCFSRIQVDPQDPTRFRCSKCGFICLRDSVDHRYRLSLRVTRDECIFGVTVFGSCLNPFFGIHAAGLQRLVENPDGPGDISTRSTLLVKAVRDCFVGRHVIFGIKVTETEPKPWLGRPPGSCSRDTKDTVQLIASQMIVPKALSPTGCTVVSYYQVLLQKVADYVPGAADRRKSSRLRESSLLLLPHHSTASSINGASLCTSGLLNQSLQRSQYQDCPLTPTPPWQQSLGLVTSSAEQEEGCSIQDSTVDDATKRDKNRTPIRLYRNNPGYRKVVEERRLSCLSPPHCSSCNSPVFARYSNSFVDKAAGNGSILIPQFCPSSTDHTSSKMKFLSTSRLTNTYLSDSLAWEDLPFSESLTEFLGKENKDFIIGGESEPNVQVQNQKETTTDNLEVRSQSKKLLVDLCVSKKYTETKDSYSQIFVGIRDTAASTRADRDDLFEQVCGKPVGCVLNSQTKTVSPEDEKTDSVSFPDDEDQLEGNTYNCSADLFSSSPTININTNTPSVHIETVVTSTETSMLLSVPKKHCNSGANLNVSHSTPHKQKLNSNKCVNEDFLILPGTQDLDFIPPSQSTPIVRVAARSGLVSKRTIAFGELQTHSPDSSSLDKSLPVLKIQSRSKNVSGNQLPQCGESTKENLWITTSSEHKVISKRRFSKRKKHLSPTVQKEAPNSETPRRLNYTCDSSFCDVTVCNNMDNDALFVPPTPAAKPSQIVRLRTQSQTESCITKLVHTEELQEEGASATSLQRGEAQARNFDGETFGKGMFDGSSYHFQDGENEACDWSRDLFSDSI
ncbi:uncharacterized protein ddias [Halichoeres trimaculatus]|uniref:uncharacterized protein ddias n=1 Tax=Halichoeres trimaculatus TaxID=147232 RepID=UPI003D9ED1D8